ncbi:hypothetical protein EXIGLDRAFT_766077 [Exidia glandulosa HHB12029]|uniref:Uncharacterized protein n=1 Tax=Exidia glandulosa HHB12029 TaxID=1314781 RepID=A0A165K121_EXIGL|nr:hypothetical protein EXIGLDRAFT_766077 [Exidia glandulosa HHB12029]
MKDGVDDLERAADAPAARKSRRVRFTFVPVPGPVRSFMAALNSDSPTSTDSVRSRPLHPSAIQQRLRELDADVDRDSVDSFEEVPLVRISYRRLLAYYTLVPVSAALSVAFFILLLFCFPQHTPPNGPDHGGNVWPLRELLVAAAAWTACYSLRGPVYAFSALLACGHESAALSTVMQAGLEESARLGVLALLAVRDEAFARAWWIALGWATAEVIVSISQAYAQLALYRDVLRGDSDDEPEAADDTPTSDERATLRPPGFAVRRYFATDSGSRPGLRRPEHVWGESAYDDPGEYLDAELTQLIAIKARAEIEDVYGVPLPNIPVFLSALQRIDAIVLAMGLTLLLAASWSRAVAAHHTGPHSVDYGKALLDTLPALGLVTAIHAGLALVWAVALPRVGVPAASYTALLAALGTLFAGLAAWGVLS